MLAATRDVTNCRLFNSTHKGAASAFYRLTLGKIKKVSLHWSLHPLKSEGMYYFKEGQVVTVVPEGTPKPSPTTAGEVGPIGPSVKLASVMLTTPGSDTVNE